MSLLFKYSPIIRSFFNKPTVKLSVPAHLNDPFEHMPNEDIKDKSNVITKSIYKGKISSDIIDKVVQSDIISGLVNQVGIVSLTETPRNLLMWAHYAQNHHGMVVGFEPDLLSHLPIKDGNRNATLPVMEKPIKIKYDNLRFDIDSLSKNTIETHEKRRELILSVLTRKSDDWIYEKEHRAILPLRFADDVRLSVQGDKPLQKEIEELLKLNIISLDHKTTKSNEEFRRIIYNPERPKFDTISKLVLNPKVTFLVSIPPEKVKCIYLGCRVDDEQYNSIFELINAKNSKLKHVEIFRYKLNTKHFSLDRY